MRIRNIFKKEKETSRVQFGSKKERRIVNKFACLECGKNYFYRVLKCPSCESSKINAYQDVVII